MGVTCVVRIGKMCPEADAGLAQLLRNRLDVPRWGGRKCQPDGFPSMKARTSASSASAAVRKPGAEVSEHVAAHDSGATHRVLTNDVVDGLVGDSFLLGQLSLPLHSGERSRRWTSARNSAPTPGASIAAPRPKSPLRRPEPCMPSSTNSRPCWTSGPAPTQPQTTHPRQRPALSPKKTHQTRHHQRLNGLCQYTR